MITSTPVARWTWGREGAIEDRVSECIGGLLGAVDILSKHGLVVPASAARISVRERGNAKHHLFNGDIRLTGSSLSEKQAHAIEDLRRNMTSGDTGAVNADMACGGIWLSPDGEHHEARLFRVGASTMTDYFTVRLSTYSDAWMSHNLRGHPQPEIHRTNRPRLASALHDLAEFVGDDTDPGDATWFGIPTEAGVDNYFEADGAATDAWDSFEIPYRLEQFHSDPTDSRQRYSLKADGPIQYTPIAIGDRVLGYVWAADADDAAGFEPRPAAGDDVFDCGEYWLGKLHDAKARGLSPSQALAELSQTPGDQRFGGLTPGSGATLSSLTALRELAARGWRD